MLSLKMVSSLLTLALAVLVCPSGAAPVPRLVDLTYSYSNITPTYPSHKKFETVNFKETQLSNTVKFKTQEILSSEHAGTHMDAPNHFVDHRLTIDQIPIENFEAPAVVVDISAKAVLNPDALLTVEDLLAWEKQYGRIPNGSVVLMFSNWGRFWKNETAYLGSTDVKKLHSPGFSGDACSWLVSERSIVGVGVDTVSADPGNSLLFPCHHHMLEVNKFILENVANMEQLPPTGATFRAFPMKIEGGTGAPTRVIATLPPIEPPAVKPAKTV